MMIMAFYQSVEQYMDYIKALSHSILELHIHLVIKELELILQKVTLAFLMEQHLVVQFKYYLKI